MSSEKGIISIGEYIALKQKYKSYPGKLINGQMFIYYDDEWITKKKFDKLVKKPIVPNFTANLNNPDKTKLWIHS